MNWTLDQLRTFLRIVDEGSMTAAARALGYTTGAVSQQMQALRTSIGTELFVREGRGVELTDAGRTLVRHARAIIEAERLAARAVRAPSDAVAHTVELGVFGSAAVAAAPPATALLRRRAPNITLHAREVDVELMPDAVATGDIDLALGLSYPASPTPLPRGVRSVPLRTERFQMVLTPELASVRNTDGAVHAANATGWIVPPAETTFGRAVRLALSTAGIEPRIAHEVTDTAVSIALAEAGLGATLVTPLMLRLYPHEVVVADLPGGASRDVVAMVRRGGLERESVLTVLEALQDVFDGAAAPDAEDAGADLRRPSRPSMDA